MEQLSKDMTPGPEAEISYEKPYEVRRKMLLPAIAKVVNGLKVGGVSDVLEGEEYYYFIKLVESD